MAQQQDSIFAFKAIELFKEQTLGMGSYGQVCKARCDDLVCAAKILHQNLFNPKLQHNIAHKRIRIAPIRKFEQEIEILSALKHPNIVQYLGIYPDPTTGVPVLLMELMDDSLTNFLCSCLVQVPFHIQVNICHDIALALAFLHANNIIHRDLSSNNVLLIGDVRAKLTDFGMARLITDYLSDSTTSYTLTKNPGSDAYMPPEAANSPVIYNEKLDCFSFGVLVIQILTRKIPSPGDPHKDFTLTRFDQSRRLQERIPEVRRRGNHIKEIDSEHPLLTIALTCLKDHDLERPSATRLCKDVEELKDNPTYHQSVKHATDSGQYQQVQTVEHIEGQHENSICTVVKLQQENMHLKQQLGKAKDQAREYDQGIVTKERELRLLKQQYEASEEARLELERRFQELKLQTQSPEEPVRLIWSEGYKSPREMCKGCDPVVHNNVVYFKPAANVEIYAYDMTNHGWLQLPNCINKCCSIAVVKDQLTTIGGYQCHDNYSNELFSLKGEKSHIDRVYNGHWPWTKEFPPMKTSRCNTTTLCTEVFLIVAGGVTTDRKVLKTVEVMNLHTLEWSMAADLPFPLYNASMVSNEDRIYIVGGSDRDGDPLQTIFRCSMTNLLPQCRKSSSKPSFKKVWKKRKVADIPVTDTTCVLVHGQLLTVGGMNWDGKTTTAVHMYNPSKRRWVNISHMSLPRSECFVAFLQAKNELIVAGGYTDKSYAVCNLTDEVELAITIT